LLKDWGALVGGNPRKVYMVAKEELQNRSQKERKRQTKKGIGAMGLGKEM